MTNDFKALFTNKNFIYLWSSQLLSQMTIQIMNFLLITYLYTKTGSTITTSLLWIAYILPAFIIGPIAAALVDMVDRRKILMLSNLGQFAIVFIFAFFFDRMIFLAFMVTFLYSLLNQFYVPAEAASLPSLVTSKKLSQANSLFFITQQVSIILGFGLGSVISNILGFKNTTLLVSIFLFAAFLVVSRLPKIKVVDKLPKHWNKLAVGLKEGYQYIKGHNEILLPFGLLLGLQSGLSVVIVNLPVIAAKIIKTSVNNTGSLIVSPAGLGALISALYIPRLLNKGWRKKTLIEISLVILSLNLLLITAIIPNLSEILRISLGIILFVISGMAFIGVMIPSQTFLQEATPGGLRGRVFGNFWFLTTIVSIIPVIFSATVTETFGVRILILSLSIITALAFGISLKFGQSLINKGVSL
ncbi:MAG: MFS transporter [Patescibacteria group bacterium]